MAKTGQTGFIRCPDYNGPSQESGYGPGMVDFAECSVAWPLFGTLRKLMKALTRA